MPGIKIWSRNCQIVGTLKSHSKVKLKSYNEEGYENMIEVILKLYRLAVATAVIGALAILFLLF